MRTSILILTLAGAALVTGCQKDAAPTPVAKPAPAVQPAAKAPAAAPVASSNDKETVKLPVAKAVAPLAAARYYPGAAYPKQIMHIEVNESCKECSGFLATALKQGTDVAVMWHPYIKDAKGPTTQVFVNAWCAGRWDVIQKVWETGLTADKTVPSAEGNPECHKAILAAKGGQSPNPKMETLNR